MPWGPAITDLAGSIPAMKQAIAGAGGDPSSLQVQASALLRKTPDGAIDVDKSLAPVAQLIDAGATEVRFTGSLPEPEHATEQFSQLVNAFRRATQGGV